MNFYELDNILQEKIDEADKAVRVRIEIKLNGHFERVFDDDIIEANFFGLKEKAGGISSRGEILLDNTNSVYSYFSVGYGTQVNVSFSLGEGYPFFLRFVFFVDEKGIQNIKGPGRKKFVFIGLQDLSYKLRKTDEVKDWSSPVVFAYSVVSDKNQPYNSLVHGIAQRAGLGVNDIDCATIPVTLPYVKLSKNVWSELSSLATAYRCHLECAPEKPLVFAHSPYQSEPLADNEYSYTFDGENMFYLRKIEKAEFYRNTVRLKINIPISLDKQEIWRYDDSPVFYDEFLQAHYPFIYPLVREIEAGKYEAKYKVKAADGKPKNVIYADQIDGKEEAENRLEYDGGPFAYSYYDITSNYDRAILTLQKDNDGNLYNASINGRPIILDLNRSCFVKDTEAVETQGTIALNVTGSYFSEYEIMRGNLFVNQYEDWALRELEERLQKKREITVKTHRALFNARVGAKVKIKTKDGETAGTINAFAFRYKKEKAFIAAFKILE